MDCTPINKKQIIDGYEPCYNTFFDLYLEQGYLQLEDVTFYLFLRKHHNYRTPTIRHMKQKFGVGQGKIYAMLERLESANLLKKEIDGYTLYEPVVGTDVPVIDTLVPEMGAVDVPKIETSVPTESTHKQTDLWESVLSNIKPSMQDATFNAFLKSSQLISLEPATIEVNPSAKHWVEKQLEKKLLRALNVELSLQGYDRVKSLSIVSKENGG